MKHSLRKTKVNSAAFMSHRKDDKSKMKMNSVSQKKAASSREAKRVSQTKIFLENSTLEAGRTTFESRTKISPIKTARSKQVRDQKAADRHKALMAIASAADEPTSSTNDTVL